MENYNKEYWKNCCPSIDCRKKPCGCGLHFVSVPASLEAEMFPSNGRYANAIVRYEGSGKVYIYSAEGVPVLVKEADATNE